MKPLSTQAEQIIIISFTRVSAVETKRTYQTSTTINKTDFAGTIQADTINIKMQARLIFI